MNAILRDKCWARRFSRTPGDLGIVRPLRRDRIPIAIWRPQQVTPKKWGVTVPPNLPTAANTGDSPSFPERGGRQSFNHAGAGVSKAARLHVGVQRPFSGQTLESEPREPGNTAPTVRGLSGESPERPAHSNTLAGDPAEDSQMAIHASPCNCSDDAQRHWALVARDLIASGRESELTDDMRQAYDYEFGGVSEPEAPQVPEF